MRKRLSASAAVYLWAGLAAAAGANATVPEGAPSGDARKTAPREPTELSIGNDAIEANGLTRQLVSRDTPCMDLHVGLSGYEKNGPLDSSSLFAPAKYRQAWCFIQAGDWLNATRAFAVVLTHCDLPLPGLTRTALTDFCRATLGDYVWAVAGLRGIPPETIADDLARFRGASDVLELMERLAAYYQAADRHDDALAVYRELLARSPDIRHRLVYLIGLFETTQTQQRDPDLTALVHELRALITALRLQPEHDPATEAPAEAALRHAVLRAHARAKEAEARVQPWAYESAEALYNEYLQLFDEPLPGAALNTPAFMTFYFAQVLCARGQYGSAAEAFEQVVGLISPTSTGRERELRQLAREELVHSLLDAVEAAERASPPELSGTEPKPIPPLPQKLLDAMASDATEADRRGARGLELTYKRARILYTYNHYDEAKAGFEAVIEHHRSSDVACFAARLLLDITHRTGDRAALRDMATSLGEAGLACSARDLELITAVGHRVALQLIERDVGQSGRWADAAAAYLFFFETHKDELTGRLGSITLHNAAVMLDRAGEAKEARLVRQMLVDGFPADDELVKKAKAALMATGS